MKWFVVAMMTLSYGNSVKDYYVFEEPNFNSKEECMVWGSLALPSIRQHLMEAYETSVKGIGMISCVNEDIVESIARDK